MDKLLTTSEVAAYFRVTPTTVTSKFTKQGLKFFPLSCKEYRYNMKDVLAFEERMKVNSLIKNEMDVSSFKFRTTRNASGIKLID